MSKIVAVHSFRGGTGKSNITANVATAIASLGKKVGVIDTDVQSPGMHVLFGFNQDAEGVVTLNDYLWGRKPIEKAVYDVTPALVGKKGGRLFLVPASIKTREIAHVLREPYNTGRLQEGFQRLLQEFQLDYLLVDTHPGINEETLVSVSNAQALLIVLRPDKQDFQGTSVTLEVARKLGVPQIFLAVNRVLPGLERSTIVQRIGSAYNVVVAGVVPNCDEIMQLGSGGLFYVQRPTHPLNREIESIARVLI